MKIYAWEVQPPPVLYGFLKTILDFKTPVRTRKARNMEA